MSFEFLKNFSILVLFFFLGCSPNEDNININDTNKYIIEKDIVWASPKGFDLTLDIYSPSKKEEAVPVLIIFHGGGWLVNNKSIMDQMAQYLATNSNYVICNVNYRLLADLDNSVTLNEIIEDAFGALLWIKENIANYGGDKNRIAVTGDSAGAHIAAMIVNSGKQINNKNNFPKSLKFTPTYMPEDKSIEEINLQNLMSVQASILSYGAFDIYSSAIYGLETSNNPFWFFSGTSPRGVFGEGYAYFTHPEMYKALSPVFNIPSSEERVLPPQFLLVGSKDKLTTPEFVLDYKKELESEGHPVDFWIYQDKGHAFLDSGTNYFLGNSFEKDAPEALNRMIKFLDKVFR
tara:strand:- start:751 stop:1794 length:1044 start_codon:yes stop_codon:yes gene_type:complete